MAANDTARRPNKFLIGLGVASGLTIGAAAGVGGTLTVQAVQGLRQDAQGHVAAMRTAGTILETDAAALKQATGWSDSQVRASVVTNDLKALALQARPSDASALADGQKAVADATFWNASLPDQSRLDVGAASANLQTSVGKKPVLFGMLATASR